MTLPAEDVQDLEMCRVGDCELKLGAEALQRVRKDVDWTEPLPQVTARVETLLRSMAFDYVNRY